MKEGWEYGKLDELITFNQIGIIRSKKEQGIDKAFKYLKMDNIHNTNGFKDEGYVFVDANEEEVAKYSLENEDFLFNTRNSYELVGKTCLFTNNTEETILFNNNIMRMRFKEVLIPKFVEFAFCSEEILEQLEKMKSGTTSVVGIYYKSLRNLQIPIPPLPEQKQIVAILDKAFAAIDQAKTNIEKNIENARELFQSKLNEIFSQKGDGWMSEFFGEVFNFRQGIQRGVKLQSETQKEGQVRFVRIVDYTQGNELPRYIDNPGAQYILNENDISLVRYGASTGFVCRGIKGALANNLFRVIPKDDWNVNSDYLYYFLNSPVFQNFIKNKMNGAAMPAISFGMISKIPFPITAIENQIDLAQKISEVEEQTNNILDAYYQKLANLEDLKKSILQKAFAGELTHKEVLNLAAEPNPAYKSISNQP